MRNTSSATSNRKESCRWLWQRLKEPQPATLFELMAATDLAELLLKQGRVPEAYKYLKVAFDRMPAGIVPVHERALQIFNRRRSGIQGPRLNRAPATTGRCL